MRLGLSLKGMVCLNGPAIYGPDFLDEKKNKNKKISPILEEIEILNPRPCC